MKKNFAPETYFDLSKYIHKALFDKSETVWDALNNLDEYLMKLIESISAGGRIKGEVRVGAKLYGDNIIISDGAIVESTAYIRGPVFIGPRSIVGPGAFIRGPVITGEKCIIGNSTEAKNTIMLDGSQASHFNYIGDSIFGNNATVGAGTQLANTKITMTTVRVGGVDTGRKSFGAVLGDGTKLGCSAVCDPGTLIQKGCLILPLTYVRGGVYEQGEKFMLKKVV
ncbi:MAG: glucose-1-phosphate thymidylyltransferase [Candidatus Liptonbacteria bacterium]|nr:glucose-1-phosphate thymidylyltransferase [Candidatus Liptonbacteria bacterium]